MKILLDWAIKVVASLTAGCILTWIFQPDVFQNGVSNINWVLLIKTLFGIAIIYGCLYLIVENRTKKLKNEINSLKDNIANKSRADHFYTTDEKERIDAIEKFGYKNENIACYVLSIEKGKNTEGAIPLYRLFAN